MKKHLDALVIVLTVAAFSFGCKKNNQPPKDFVHNTVAVALPSFLSVKEIESESIPIGMGAFKTNFKATLAPKENLYEIEKEIPGDPIVVLLRTTQTTEASTLVYGHLVVNKLVDMWAVKTFEIETGLQQFGKPRGAFGPECVVSGTEEASKALRRQTDNAKREKEEKERLAAAEIERNRILKEEQKALERIVAAERQRKLEEQKKAESSEHQRILRATFAGACYKGTVTRREDVEHICLTFVEQDDFMVKAEVVSLSDKSRKAAFAGKLSFKAVEDGEDLDYYHITMTSLKGRTWEPLSTSLFFSGSISLQLRLTDKGILQGKVSGKDVLLQADSIVDFTTKQ